MPPAIPLLGRRFGRLLVLRRSTEKAHYARWECQCDCGAITSASSKKLLNGQTKSCGCLRKEVSRDRMLKHGLCGTKAFGVWRGMIRRCYDTKAKSYPRYGGRGILVCSEWRQSFVAFHQDMGDPLPGMTLEREDTNGPYCKENCRWATMKEQQNNRTNNRLISCRGKTLTVAQWSELRGINYGTLFSRIYRSKQAPEIALGFPPLVRRKK